MWCNGGDGTWKFSNIRNTLNRNNEFYVDSGNFCVIDIRELERYYEENPTVGWNGFEMKRNDSLLFEKEPTLYVEDGVVYINDIHDDSMKECDNCEELVYENDIIWSKSGDMYCYYCYDESEEEE